MVARELVTTQTNTSHHLRQLLTAGLIVDAGEVVVRGGRARLDRHQAECPAPAEQDRDDRDGVGSPVAGDSGAVLDAPAVLPAAPDSP